MSGLAEVLHRVAAEADPADALAYEVLATDLARHHVDDAIAAGRSTLLQPGDGGAERFLLFCVAIVACRRRYDRVTARLLVDATRDEFAGEPLYWHFRSLTYLLHGSASDLREGLAAARKARSLLPDNPGVLHTLANCHADLAETGARDRAQLDEALVLVDRAIELAEGEPREVRALYRGRFYYTRARFLRRLGRFDEARDDLLKAIELEEPGAGDHAQRVGEYTVELALIDASRALEDLTAGHSSVESRLKETAERLEGAELRVVQVVTFVAGVLAILQVGVSAVGSSRPFWQVVAMIVLLAAVVFGAMVVGSMLMTRRRRVEREPA